MKTNYEPYDLPNDRLVELTASSNTTRPKVLDVGCWGGALGYQVRKLKDCQFDGIDINEEALAIAAQNGYLHTFKIDLNTSSFEAIEDNAYDIIVFGDVLEHTIDPDAVLRKLVPKLISGGFIVVSLPNIAFIVYRLKHMIGKWEYENSGVMDRTHLRFFTYRSMHQFFQRNNLQILEEYPYIGIKNRPRVIQKLMRLLAKGIPSLFALQIVFKVKPVENANL